ncbi:MAG: FAD-dependent oxidoreductase [Planctomycetes bacterium]|nr:FAD-dependent oxidoreductase [Planctomycetota bacterium]
MNTTTRTPAASTHPADLPLGIGGFTFLDLHRPERLADLHAAFLAELRAADPVLSTRWTAHAEGRERQRGPAESELLIALSRHLSAFVARLFRVEQAAAARRERLTDRLVVYRVRDRFVKKLVKRAVLQDGRRATDVHAAAEALLAALPGREGREIDAEERFAMRVWNLLERAADERAVAGRDETVAQALELLALSFKLKEEAQDPALTGWRMLRKPHELDWEHSLVHYLRPSADLPEAIEGRPELFRRRDGFKLTDRRTNDALVMNEIDQCVFCHEREKDSCSKGLRDKKSGELAKNPLGIELAGCPLDEHISEMHALYAEGDPIAALLLVTINNPMCPGTGHRICNDCMKACIYQKQEPVNIPQVETKALSDVLELPWGPEIWLLTTRWNPLRVERPHALSYNGINVLVVGMGPAGYTLAHYLTQEGFGVVALDGLKVEPLPGSVTGRLGKGGEELPPAAVAAWQSLSGELDERVLLGFGGVSEYGITVRWDKNFLTLPYLSLMRRENFDLHGGVRFGGALDLDDAWRLGFDHVAIATGAGKPTIVDMRGNLARGVRKASDFLMALQLTGAFKKNSLACLQLRLPVVVIGGGLTGVDTATEALAYYPVQVEKVAGRYDVLCERFGEEAVRRFFNEEERAHLDEFLRHGRAVAAERERARKAGLDPDFVALVRAWGGVRLVYRKTLNDSPAYRLNHEEVQKALEEGITFVECMSPVEVLQDRFGAARAVRFERQKQAPDGRWSASGEFVEMPAAAVLVAAGTSPNITYEREQPGTFALDEKRSFFQVGRLADGAFAPVKRGRDEQGAAFLTSYVQGTRTVSVYGDNHAAYAGNVVKAMASARDGYHSVVAVFRERLAALSQAPTAVAERRAAWRKLLQKLDFELVAVVHEVNRLTPTITEVVVHAPAAARRFEPGQFYRLQNFEAHAPDAAGTKLALEGLALTGAWTDPAKGLLSMIVLEMGASSRLCAILKPGERVVVMGPTGTPTEIPKGEKVILAGGGLGNAVLFSIGRALRKNGCQVVYFAAFRRGEDLFKREELESAADVVVWSTDAGHEIEPARHRPWDRHFRGNVVQAMKAYASGELDETLLKLADCERIICIGSDRMMNAVREARFGVLQPFLKPGHVAIGSINSPMQCMMKEICAQCLCKHVDPATGQELPPVFSCFNQDQPLDNVDFENLMQRLRANSAQEKLTNLWLDHLVHECKLPIWSTL